MAEENREPMALRKRTSETGRRLIAAPLDGSPAGFLSTGQGVRYRSKFCRPWSRRSAAVFDPTATFEWMLRIRSQEMSVFGLQGRFVAADNS
jgi:hypothetical protein